MPDRKIFFAVNLPLKTPRDAVANADTGSLKSLHTLFDMGHMQANFEPNRIVLIEMYLIWRFLTKHRVFMTIFDKALTSFCKTFL